MAKVSFIAIAVVLLACEAIAQQQSAKIPLVSRLSVFANVPRSEAFRQGLRELGYLEGKNVLVEARDSGGKLENTPGLIAEILRRKPDVIVSVGPAITRAAKQATATIPIVMANDPDPVGDGFVTSLARPDSNITGLSALAPELAGKRLEIMREVVTKLSRLAVLGTSTLPGYGQTSKEIDLAAKTLGVSIQHVDVLDAKDVEPGFRIANKARAQAILTFSGPFINSQRAKIIALANRNRLPAMYYNNQFVEDGGLMYYGVNLLDLDRRAATYVDKILKGRKPTELPIEQPMKFEFIINLKAAKQIDLMIPPNVLVRADKVIK